MAELTQELAHRLIGSTAWKAYCDTLIAQYWHYSNTLDQAREDHRHLQGRKLATQEAIELPYRVAQQPSPLTQSPGRSRRAAAPRHTEEEETTVPVRTRRAAYLA